MKLASVLDVLSCPQCKASLKPLDEGVVCAGPDAHRFGVSDGFLAFAEIDPGKYEASYATRYAALWAFGYETLHSGLDEPLYRTVSSLAAEVLVRLGEPPVIVDAGCGVGRVAA
ncbi:MAG: hypothetical protein GY856_47585, partial [bacterium]|nr:hypothetical protein [bacterium]